MNRIIKSINSFKIWMPYVHVHVWMYESTKQMVLSTGTMCAIFYLVWDWIHEIENSEIILTCNLQLDCFFDHESIHFTLISSRHSMMCMIFLHPLIFLYVFFFVTQINRKQCNKMPHVSCYKFFFFSHSFEWEKNTTHKIWNWSSFTILFR